MNTRRFGWGLLLLIIALATASADARQRPVHRPDHPPPHDIFSAAETAEIRTSHLALDLEVDFDALRLRGSATHTIINLHDTRRFIVDTRGLEIEAVTIDGNPTEWSLASSSAVGRPLTIDIEPWTRTVRIDYETTTTSDGLHWLTARQTTAGIAPFLYTFGQPDHTREWIPLQDTPGVRMTYEATIRVPPGLYALMSARNPIEPIESGIYHFEMPYPIPPYLIALAVGHLEFHPFDDRTGVYAEPDFVEEALWDLQYVPEMLDVAERLMGPYPFERYDVLLLPPGYPAGGMENPMLNFLNVAGVVSGNRESPPVPHNVMAHEIAHSWAGDSVTCATWSDTWLNEGFATYYANRILEEMMGHERAEIGFYWDRLNYESFVANTKRDPGITVLHRQFSPGDSLSIFNPTNYNKGSLFLEMLENRMGRDAFDTFIRSYFQRYAMDWVDDHAFLAHLSSSPAFDSSLQVEEWVYGKGMPSNVTAPTRSSLWDRVGVEADRFRAGVAASGLDTSDWTSFELSLFLWQITDVVPQRMAELDAAFGLSAMKSPSIHWFLGVATTLYDPGMPMLERFLLLGSWNILPVYQRLAQTAEARIWALELYNYARPRYVPGIRQYLDLLFEFQSSWTGRTEWTEWTPPSAGDFRLRRPESTSSKGWSGAPLWLRPPSSDGRRNQSGTGAPHSRATAGSTASTHSLARWPDDPRLGRVAARLSTR